MEFWFVMLSDVGWFASSVVGFYDKNNINRQEEDHYCIIAKQEQVVAKNSVSRSWWLFWFVTI